MSVAALTKIAKQHGTTVKKLQAANPQLKDPNKLKVGEMADLITLIEAFGADKGVKWSDEGQ